MTDLVNPSPNRAVSAQITAATIERAAHAPGGGWVVPASDSVIEATPLNAFAPEQSSADLDVQIDTGEAIVGGVYLGRDVTSTVTLAASTTDQTVYVGGDLSAPDTVIVGLASDFASGDPRIPVATYETDASSVTAFTDKRVLGRQVDVQNQRYEGANPTAVAKATSTSQVAGRSATLLVRDARTAPIPVGRLQDGDRSRTLEYVPSGLTLKVIGITLLDESGQAPAGLTATVSDGSGTEQFSTNNRRTVGTLDTPLVTLVGEQAPVTFAVENATGDIVRAGGTFAYIIE
ncbi:hypothetical protein [Halomarina litorea]|uniref:hypothetical protein n=1 Tax=Halomarina litorea TaxID=2961595 RepID=UPI0020C239B9|nr:hypothetical protein [Halomarina sp. BCD28]